MSDHHRSSSYYKDSYGSSSSSSKRYHSPADAPRMGLSSGDYYEPSDSRSKRSRTDNYGAHTSSTRYADYSASSSSASGSRYKTTSSSSSYYDLPGYKPSTSSSSASKYLEDYKGSGSSRSTSKSNVRRIPPPLTPPSLSSKSSLRLQPLMKVSLSSSSSGAGSSKDYYGSRMRQAPPEHHYSYSGSHGSSYGKPEFKRPANYASSKSVSSIGYHSTSRVHGGTVNYRSTAATTRRLVARSRAPPIGLNSRIRGRHSLVSSRRDDDLRRRKISSLRKDFKSSRSGSRDNVVGARSTDKTKQDTQEENAENDGKKIEEDIDYVNIVEGQVVVEEVAGDDEDDHQEDGDGSHCGEANDSTDKTENQHKNEEIKMDQLKSNVDETKTEGKKDDDSGKGTADKSCEDHDKPASRALLKLHCPYCEVHCISFREFTFHLRSSIHTRTMSSAVSEMKRKLGKVRQEMKDDQRKREKAEKVLSDTSSYCRVCELSFRTDPKEHEANEIHNKIKALIYRRCDICNIDFRIWKVYIYHLAALEHAKRVAMKELQEAEAKGDKSGTNLSPDELGMDLVEIRTVFYCNACMRYIPIKGQTEDAKMNHCMTLNHLKSVEEFNERERRRAQREEARERVKRRKQEENDKSGKIIEDKDKVAADGDKTTNENDSSEVNTNDKVDDNNTENVASDTGLVQIKVEPTDTVKDGNDAGASNDTDNKPEDMRSTENTQMEGQKETQNDAEEDDDDEIELHAGEDDVEDEDESEVTRNWSRRTRSSQRGDESSN